MRTKGILFQLLTAVGLVLIFSVSQAAEVVTPSPISGRNSTSTLHVIPADVLARVRLLSSELNLVRKALGKPRERQQLISVSNASPREVYFEAQALYQKANSLAYEITGGYVVEPAIHSDELMPAHVWQLVDAALKRVLVVKKQLGIKTKVKEVRQPESTTPTDVFNSILQANQELNLLLYRRVSPSEVYEQVTLAINYTANLLQYFNVVPRIPAAPQLIENKTPSNVYRQLVRCVQVLQQIAEQAKIKMLKVHVNDLGLHQVRPSNVFDLSKIIVAEVRYFNTLLPQTQQVKAYFPGYKTPSQAYQRTGVLLKQLNSLRQAVEDHPGLLSEQRRG